MKSIKHFLIASIFLGNLNITAISAVPVEDSIVNLLPDTKVTTKFQDEFDELIKAASELYKQRKYDEALAKCKQAAELRPKDFRPHYYSGVIYMALSKYQNASESFAKAIELKPDDKYSYLHKANADYLRGAKEEALAMSRKALEIDPAYAEAYLNIGDILQDDEKRRDEAEAAYRAAVKADPGVVKYFETQGYHLLYQEKDEKGAEKYFRRAMEFDPNRMAGRFELGRLLVEQGRLKEARTIWEGRKSDEDNTFPNFITLLERAEKLQQATDALAKNPNNPDVLLQMGNAVMEGDHWVVDGRQERAVTYFRKALKLRPKFAAAQYAITKAYIQIADTYENKNKNVDEELEKLRKFDPKLAKEMEEYRKNYSGGFRVAPTNVNQ